MLELKKGKPSRISLRARPPLRTDNDSRVFVHGVDAEVLWYTTETSQKVRCEVWKGAWVRSAILQPYELGLAGGAWATAPPPGLPVSLNGLGLPSHRA